MELVRKQTYITPEQDRAMKLLARRQGITEAEADMEIAVHDSLSRFADQDLSYVDALSLHVITSRDDIEAVFALDHHLALAGKPVLPEPLPARKR